MMIPAREGTVHLIARNSVKDAIGDLVTASITVEVTQIIGKLKRYFKLYNKLLF